jgi:hypothetical protein
MSRYTKQLDISTTETGYRVTITETVGDEQPIVTTLELTEAELKAYTDAEIDKAAALQDLYEGLALRAAGEQRAFFRELNKVNQNDYYDRKRPKIKEWTDNYNFRYLNTDGQEPIDCTINASGFVRPIDGTTNFLRVTFDSRRRIQARVPGGNLFTMLSTDEEWWVGTDDNNVTHRLRRVQKPQR